MRAGHAKNSVDAQMLQVSDDEFADGDIHACVCSLVPSPACSGDMLGSLGLEHKTAWVGTVHVNVPY
jgi:hypothetical protein